MNSLLYLKLIFVIMISSQNLLLVKKHIVDISRKCSNCSINIGILRIMMRRAATKDVYPHRIGAQRKSDVESYFFKNFNFEEIKGSANFRERQ